MKIVTAKIRANYSVNDEQRAAVINAVRCELITAGLIDPSTPEITYTYHEFSVLMTSDDLVTWLGRDELNVELDKGPHKAFIPNFIQALAEVNDKQPHSLHWEKGEFHRDFNQVVNVHTPGNALSLFNETMLAQDACTDGLQDMLNQGWRIIAVCPQPDQRRPDYILGRFSADLDVNRNPMAQRMPKMAGIQDN